jgi:heme-degrading monooxygenase HmoA
MHARAVNFTGVKDIDAGIKFVQEKVLPKIKDQKGYRGLTASADRAGGVFGVLTLWDTVEDLDASEAVLAPTRQEGAQVMGGQMKVDRFELLFADVGQEPPAPGSAVMISQVSMDPGKVDENTEFFKSNVVPRMKASEGFRGVRNMMNRTTGEGMVGTAWSDAEALKRAAAGVEAQRAEARTRGVKFGDISMREIVLVDQK